MSGLHLGELVGLRLQHLAEVDSTNRVVADAARSGAPAGLVVVADRQSAGRGRLGRAWFAEPGEALTVSLLRRPLQPVRMAWAWTLMAGLAAFDLVEEHAPGAAWLKWPNDLQVGPRKAGGILCELITRGADLDALVVGLGLNLREPSAGWPADIADRAVALDTVAPVLVDRGAALRGFCGAFLRREEQLQSHGIGPLLSALEAAMAPMIGREVIIDGASARVLGIGQNGALRVLGPDGERPVLAGDVHLTP